jgi:hypothetical protein
VPESQNGVAVDLCYRASIKLVVSRQSS